jgi:peptide/nickel transport system ATP-binding protein
MTAPLLTVDHLRIEAARTGAVVVDDVSFAIERGEFLAVVGESGSGKTAAARAILGLLPSGLRHVSGQIRLDGEDLADVTPRRMRTLRGRAIGMVFQEPMVSLNPAISVGAQMAEGLTLHEKLAKSEIRRRCLDMLARVQIRDPERTFDAYPHEFSGGMRQRIMLASVMLLKPKLLLADEPTTALDTLSQREVLDLMVELARDHGTSVMLITHNLGLVSRYAQRAVVLRQGRVVETGSVRQILSAPREAYTRQLVDALPRRRVATTRRAAGEPLISVHGLKVSFGGRQRLFRRDADVAAVDGVDLEIGAGETVAVVGGSGSGKTTLGRAMLRLIPSAGGEIRFQGRDVIATRFAWRRSSCSRIRIRRSTRACASARSSPSRCAMSRGLQAPSATAVSPPCSTRSGSPASRSAGRMSSPAASASASRSHAPSCGIRCSWSRTSRSLRST